MKGGDSQMTKFEEQLHQLMDEHNVGFEDHDIYDGNESYCGSYYYFRIDGELINITEILGD